MGVVESACLFPRSRKACRHSVFFIVVTLFGIASAQVTWTKQPNDPTFGVLGENVILEWGYNIVVNDKLYSFDLRRLERFMYKDVVKYVSSGTNISLNSRISLAKKSTPVFLIIIAIKSDETSYCCIIVTQNSYKQSCVKLELLVHPNITAISRNQTSNETNDVTLSCNATGKPPPNVTWSRQGNKEWKYPGSILPLRNISRDQHGEYWCTAKNNVSNTTASVTIIVNYAPSIALTAKSYNVTEGESVELYCASDSRPPPTVTWSMNSGQSNSTYPPGQRLNITKTNRTEAGTYTCTAANGIGKHATATMQVNVFYPPSIDTRPIDQTLNETEDLRVVCNAIGNPMPYVTWSKVTLPHPTPINTADGVLTINNVNKTHSGVYQCRATNGFGSGAFASITVTVNYAPSIALTAKNYNVTEGESVELYCASDGKPPPTVTWSMNSGLSNSTYPTGQRLNITKANRTEAGTYTCTAANGIGKPATATMQVNVFYPPSIDRRPINQTLNETQDLRVVCSSIGNPMPCVTWSKVTLPHPTPINTADGVLTINNVNKTHSGVYQCRATNGFGSGAFASITVTVNYKPVETSLTSDAQRNVVVEGHSVTFFCTADSLPRPELELRFNNTLLGFFTNGTITLQRVNSSNHGTYECVARNILGSGPKATLKLTVQVPPSIDYISPHITVNETDDVKIFCNASGSPKPNTTWTFLGDSADMKPVTMETLLLSSVNRNQTGRYRCTAANGVTKPDSADVLVTINYKPKLKGQPLAEITSWLNHETEVTCEAEGVPLPDIVWSRNGTVTSSVQLPVRVSTLKFIPREASDFAGFTCTAKNLLGLTKASITIKRLDVPSAPKILKIHRGRNDLEIHWDEVSTADPQNPILSYMVQVKEKGKSQEWMNCTQITRQTSSMMCGMEELKSNTEYIVRVSARNVVGHSEFTVKDVSTKEEGEKKEKQRQLPGSTVDWIVGGVIGGCGLLVLLVVIIIATKRRSRSQGLLTRSSEKVPVDGRSSKKVTITSYDNPTMESSLQTDVSEEQAK